MCVRYSYLRHSQMLPNQIIHAAAAAAAFKGQVSNLMKCHSNYLPWHIRILISYTRIKITVQHSHGYSLAVLQS